MIFCDKAYVDDSFLPSGDSDPKQDTPVPRKRRWGSSRSNESLTISSESLKVVEYKLLK